MSKPKAEAVRAGALGVDAVEAWAFLQWMALTYPSDLLEYAQEYSKRNDAAKSPQEKA